MMCTDSDWEDHMNISNDADDYWSHWLMLLMMAWTNSCILDWNMLIVQIIETSADSSWHQV